MKTTKIHRFGQNQQLFTQTIKFGSFPQLSCRKLQKCLISWKKKTWKKSSTWPKLATFAQTTMFRCFPQRFSYKLQKVLISWKIMKNHRFSQNYQLFAQTIMFSAKRCKTCLLASSNSGLLYCRFQQVVAQTVGFERLKLPKREPSQSFPFEAWYLLEIVATGLLWKLSPFFVQINSMTFSDGWTSLSTLSNRNVYSSTRAKSPADLVGPNSTSFFFQDACMRTDTSENAIEQRNSLFWFLNTRFFKFFWKMAAS